MDKLFDKYFQKHQLKPNAVVISDVKVVVPVYLEEDDLFIMLNSVCAAAQKSSISIELVLVFNYAETDSEEVKRRQKALLTKIKDEVVGMQNNLPVTILEDFDVKRKHAGVGHARKTGMDYAAQAFVKQNKPDGIIISLDADCVVENNYFEAINQAYSSQPIDACNIYFEHPIEGEYPEAIYSAITEYELHLRYYIQALRFADFPFAYHTVGSCFSVTAHAYIRAGGMPRKQAGEDFYFLQKIIPLGRFAEVNTTTVIPSSRPSDRVPFGTGPSINHLVESGDEYQTYNLQAFIDLKELLAIKEQLFKISEDDIEEFTHQLSGRMRSYLVNSDFFTALKPINDNCGSLEVFKKRFFEVFSAFRVVKYLNYSHTHFLEKTPVFEAAINLLELKDEEAMDIFDSTELLLAYRQLEKA